MVTAIFPAGVHEQVSDTLHVYKSRHSENHDIIKQEFSTGLSARGASVPEGFPEFAVPGPVGAGQAA